MTEKNAGPASPGTTPKTFEQRAYAKVTWRLMPLLFISYIIAYLDRVNVGFAKLQMSQDLSFSSTVYGLGAGLFFIGYFIFEVPSNIMLHRLGARVWIARIMLSWGIISALTMFVKTPTMFYVARFLLGVAEAGFFPGIILYLTYWYPSQRRGRIVALLIAANPISGLLGGPISGWIMQTFSGARGLAGWQWLFLLEGIPALIAGFFVLFFLDDGIRKAAWLAEDEKQLLETNIAAEAQQKQSHSMRDAFRSGWVWVMSFVYFCFLMGMYGVTFWMPTMIKTSGVKSVFHVGLLTAIPFTFGLVVMLLVSRSSDLRRERRFHCAIPSATCGVALVLTALYGHATVPALIFLSIAFAGSLTSLPVSWSLPTAILGGTAAAAGIAVVNSIGNLSGFLGNYMVGWLTDLTHSTNAGMYMLSIFAFLGAAIVLVFVPAKMVNK